MVKKICFVLLGLFLTALGIKLLSLSNLTFGGTAGIATVFSYLTPLSWGGLFFIVNLPFFIISYYQLGKWFTLSSFISIIGISLLADSLDVLFPYFELNPMIATLFAGILIGTGVTFVLNNGSSLGGIHILALYLDKRFNINRGICIFISDFLIILLSIILVDWQSAIFSVISIFIASFIIGRYKAKPMNSIEVDEKSIILNDSTN